MAPKLDPDDILEAARCIRFHLPGLVGDAAAQLDQQIAKLLAQAKTDQTVHSQLLELLKSRPQTRDWMAEFLSSQRSSKGFERLPGSSQAIAAPKYICAEGDYVWYRRSAGATVPTCPTHGPLISANGS